MLFQRFRVPGLRPYYGLNRPEPTPPTPPAPPHAAAESRGQAELLTEVVDTPVFHVGKFGRRKTSDPDPKLRTTRSLAGFSVRPRPPPSMKYYEQGRDNSNFVESYRRGVLPSLRVTFLLTVEGMNKFTSMIFSDK